MQTRSLAVLGLTFGAAFLGRIAVMAETFEGTTASTERELSPAVSAQCVTGSLAEEVKKQIAENEQERLRLAEKRSEVEVFSEHIERRIAELEALNAALNEKLAADRELKDAARRQVGVIYSQMKPAAAGGIISEMDPRFAAGLLQAMAEESSSAILASLSPERAYAITVLMAGDMIQ